MAEPVAVGLVLLALAVWIALPLLGRRTAADVSQQDGRRGDLLESKQSIYRSIVDLELDHEMGKISSEDYRVLKQQSKVEALGIIRELGDSDPGGSGEDRRAAEQARLEDEIRAARARLRRT